MKKPTLVWLGLVLGVGLILYGITYWNSYALDDNVPDIEQVLEDRSGTEVTVKGLSATDDKAFFIFTMSGQIGSGELSRGWNGKYKLEYYGYGTDRVRSRVVETGKGFYLMLAGRNEGKIGSIRAAIDHEEYEVELPSDEYYLVLTPVKKTDKRFAESIAVYQRDGTKIY
jgi:hypothetical protein